MARWQQQSILNGKRLIKKMGISAMSGIGEVTLATYSQLICFNSNGPLSQETISWLNFIWKKL